MAIAPSNVLDCALVFEGGGYRGSFSAGVSSALLEEGIYFDYVCGLSAGASNTVNYVSRDRWRVREAFMVGDKVKDAVGLRSFLRGRGYFDADFLYEEAIQNGVFPFDWDTFTANPARLCIQAFERDTGRTVRFRREDMTSPVRLASLVRASSTLPGFMRPNPVDDRVLYDGGLGAGAGIPVCLAEDDGLERFLFVATRVRGYRKQPPTDRERKVYTKIAKDYPYLRNAMLTRWERYNDALAHVEELAEQGRALIIYPDEMNVSSSTVNPKKLEATFEQGYRQAVREMGRIRAFLFGSPDAGPAAPARDDGYVTIG